MRSLSIQVQPDLIPEPDIEKIRRLFEDLKCNSLVEKTEFDEGNDKGHYLNFTYGTHDPQSLWADIQKKIYQHTTFGTKLLECSIAMCSGEEGWNNYMLLYHFDPTVPTKTFE